VSGDEARRFRRSRASELEDEEERESTTRRWR
jgi:hypothetical protein